MSASYDKTTSVYAKQRTEHLRAMLRKDYEQGKYWITKDDEIHVFGKMPNSTETGRYFLGYRAGFERDYAL